MGKAILNRTGWCHVYRDNWELNTLSNYASLSTTIQPPCIACTCMKRCDKITCNGGQEASSVCEQEPLLYVHSVCDFV